MDRAIRAADLDLNPNSDGTMLRIPIPPLSQERRKQLAKSISRMAEEHKNALRQVRRDANQRLKKLVKNKQLSEDLEHDLEADVQKADRCPHDTHRRTRRPQGIEHSFDLT